MTQTEFALQTGPQSQATAILGVLVEHRGSWVSMPLLARLSGSLNVHSRVADLRKRGEQIEHRNERDGRTVRSFYRVKR